MATIAESPQFEATEVFQKAKALRRRFDKALMNTPEFLEAAGRILLNPWSNSDTMGGYRYNVQWTRGGTRFVVALSNSRWGETLQVSMYTGAIGEGIAINILGRNKDQGEFRYSKAHASGVVIDAYKDDLEALSKAEEILGKLTQV